MNKIARIGCIALGVLGVIFLFLVFMTGDEEIKMAASVGEYGVITPYNIIKSANFINSYSSNINFFF